MGKEKPKLGRPKKYATEEERIAAKKASQRASGKRWALRHPEQAAAKSARTAAARTARYVAKNPAIQRVRVRTSHLKREFGLSHDDYERMNSAQGGVCAICKCHNGKRRLAVDHDHVTGAIRGLLCSRCNMAIGLMKDDPSRLRLAADYLESQS